MTYINVSIPNTDIVIYTNMNVMHVHVSIMYINVSITTLSIIIKCDYGVLLFF